MLSVPFPSFTVDPPICAPYSVTWQAISTLPGGLVTDLGATLDIYSMTLADVGVYSLEWIAAPWAA